MRLLEPLALGAVTAPNRVLFGPHETNFGAGRALSDRHIAYYERRAVGGTGVLVTEEATVHDSDWPYERAPRAADCGPGFERLASIGRRHGTVMLAGLGHTGGQGASAYSQRELWAPSGVPEVNTREVPKVMEAGDIAEVVQGFGAATAIAVGAGLDGVEINAGQNSLIRQFLSGLNNLRGDDYGTDRLRFAREVLHAVRVAAGDRVVGLRLSCDELAPWAGIVPEVAAEIAAALRPWIDYLVVVRGGIFSVSATRPDGHDQPGFNLDLTRDIRAALDGAIPVFAQGSIVDWGQAEWAIDDGRCDGVEMTRAQIADASLVAKLRADQPARIRPCILCNQTCRVRDNRNPMLTCVVDPRSGHELVDADPEATAAPEPGTPLDIRPLNITVVGGGVAGLETARVAAGRGHTVRVLEQADQLGGMLRTAAAGAGRDRLALFADWLEAECRELGVSLEPGHCVDASTIIDQHHLALCTGSVGGVRTFDADDDAEVRDAVDVLRAAQAGVVDLGLPEGPVALWDPIGGPIAVSVAELLAGAGRDVTLMTPDFIVGTLLSRSGDLAPANTRLAQAGVHFVKRVVLRSAHAGHVTVEDRYTGATSDIAAAVLIDAGQRLPNESLSTSLRPHRQAGDTVAPRTVLEAVLEARRVALAFEGSH